MVIRTAMTTEQPMSVLRKQEEDLAIRPAALCQLTVLSILPMSCCSFF